MIFTIEDDRIQGHLQFDKLSISPNENVGYRPFELFVSSLVGCSGTLLRTILTKKRINYSNIELEASAVRNPTMANRIEKIVITANVQSDRPIESQTAEKIAYLVVKNCGMIQSVNGAIDVSFIVQSLQHNGDNH